MREWRRKKGALLRRRATDNFKRWRSENREQYREYKKARWWKGREDLRKLYEAIKVLKKKVKEP
jgi:hypothetical protein